MVACGPSAKSKRSYDQIREMVSGKTASEVKRLLGPPNRREALLLGDERWIWLDYTYLGGEQYPPKLRGRIVHLEITFESLSSASEVRNAKAELRVSEPYGVGFSLPGTDAEVQVLPLNKELRKGI
jgi:hypothetical protein